MSISFVVYGWALDAFSMAAVIWTAVVAAAVFGIVWHIVTRPLWTETAVALAIADAAEGV
jgi:hypothetical protein